MVVVLVGFVCGVSEKKRDTARRYVCASPSHLNTAADTIHFQVKKHISMEHSAHNAHMDIGNKNARFLRLARQKKTFNKIKYIEKNLHIHNLKIKCYRKYSIPKIYILKARHMVVYSNTIRSDRQPVYMRNVCATSNRKEGTKRESGFVFCHPSTYVYRFEQNLTINSFTDH